jgi:hypothetical protein
MATLLERAIGAARLDTAVYEEVEHDPTALGQALTVVVIASIATGIGSAAAGADGGIGGLVMGVLISLVAWFVWALITWLVGTRVLPSAQTQADLGQLLRALGFAAAPGVIGILGILPLIGGLVLFVAWIWQLAAMVVAVRQALDYESTGRAVGVCLIGFVAYVLIAFVLFGSIMMTMGGGPTPEIVTP